MIIDEKQIEVESTIHSVGSHVRHRREGWEGVIVAVGVGVGAYVWDKPTIYRVYKLNGPINDDNYWHNNPYSQWAFDRIFDIIKEAK